MVVEAIPKFVGFLYGLGMIGIIAYLWYSGRWRDIIGKVILLISTVLGFLIFAPVMPYQFEQLILQNEQALGGPLIGAVIGLSILFILTLVFGRFFCGYLCPVGAVQEIAYLAPLKKIQIHQKQVFMTIRAIFTITFLILVFFLSISILSIFGIRDFFYLVPTLGSVLFLLLLVVATIFYRPFCRLACPVGLILSLAASKSLFKVRRTSACINCRKCEKVCPVDEAKRDDMKAECYLCGRCMEVCPTEGAERYERMHIHEK